MVTWESLGLKASKHPSGHLFCTYQGRMWYVHRLIWTLNNGSIPPGMVVHHVNGEPTDNRLENLELLAFGEHSRHHQTESNSFKGHHHTRAFRMRRAQEYAATGNPNYRHDVRTEEIREMRAKGSNWSAIGRALGISRGCAQKRLLKGAP